MQCVISEYWVDKKGLSEEVTFKTLEGETIGRICCFLLKKLPSEQKILLLFDFFKKITVPFGKLAIHFSSLNLRNWE